MRGITRRERERRGKAVTGVMFLLWLVYLLALSQAVDAQGVGDPTLVGGWLVAVLFGLVILVTLFVFDRWIKRGKL